RLDVVSHLYTQNQVSQNIEEWLKQIGDIERLVSKIALNRINPRELYQLHKSLKVIAPLKAILQASNLPQLVRMSDLLNPCIAFVEKIHSYMMPDPPMLVNKGSVIATGISAELDELRAISLGGKDYLLQMQQREAANTGITSLKISYNNVFGYYIEVTHAHKNKVPTEWIRKQTLTSAERYITEELKIYEEKILGAEEKILRLEEQIYSQLVLEAIEYIQPIQQNAQIIAQLDCLLSFAKVALKFNYHKPTLNEGHELKLIACRHPVIEQMLPAGEHYISNDIILDKENTQVMILTGPNMSGKSALLRQTALAVLMAQIGSFVPCDSAEIGIIDKLYTRVGASDNLSGGESTFMVEMLETASILNNLSDRSLILLDEIGRGTSTYDGVSLAWSIAEYLNHHKTKPKTLFATHYHELNELEAQCKGIVNYHISLKEIGNKIIFLRKLLPGGSEHSFGIHVAKMAGIPKEVLDRSNEILSQLEEQRGDMDVKHSLQNINQNQMQLSMFSLDDPLLVRINEELRKIDVNTLTPVEALMKLNYLKQLMEKVH
ncbi:MAG: DNA mismatch repair protein MutS, partial [Bacteroidetes bacterium]|nr:DNA mismatch repair protein MutS [Bacteroidota bacterium]